METQPRAYLFYMAATSNYWYNPTFYTRVGVREGLYEKRLQKRACALNNKIGKIPPSLALPKPPHIQLEERFISLLQACRNLSHLEQILDQIFTHGLHHSQFVTPKIVAACAQSKNMVYARHVFERISRPNVFLWNSMFKGCCENELHGRVLVLFDRMKKRDVRPNAFTFTFVLKSCGKMPALREGEEVHCCVIKSGFGANAFVGTTLIDMYSGGGVIGSAGRVFDEMPERNVVTWTAIVSGYISSNDLQSARRLFDQAPELDVVLWNTMVSGYVAFGDMVSARRLFDDIPTKDVMAWNTILNGYASNSDFANGERLFEEMPERNVFSWNGLIGGYARHGRFFDVLGAFRQMLSESDVAPNDTTLVTVLSACSRLGSLDVGKWVHVYSKSNGFKENVYVGNGLIDMYAKCGSIDSAIDVFNDMNFRDLITWNSMIGGLAMHGRGTDALNFFHRMMKDGERPDGITFIGVLCACTHMGLVKDGFSYFRLMTNHYSIVPQIEHYGCMVDLLGRAGLLSEAVDFVRKMPIEADCVIWSALLGACRIYKDVRLAEIAVQELIRLEPTNVANYVLLSNLYGSVGMWEDVARMKLVMREMGVRKLPGCSLIEVNDGVVEFYSSDKSHSQTEKIYCVLRGLTKVLKLAGYEPGLEEFGEGT